MALPLSGAAIWGAKSALGAVRQLSRVLENSPLLREATAARNTSVIRSLLGPAYRGLIQRRGHGEDQTDLQPGGLAHFDWRYRRDLTDMQRLYEAAKVSQWNATTDVRWDIDVDPFNLRRKLVPDEFIPTSNLPIWRKLSPREKAIQRHAMLSWLLSQFLHGEQGALFAAAQVTEAVPWMDAKLFGGTQVMDEARHVEAFHRYLTTKLERVYEINDNLYVVIDAVMSDARWDVKFLGMQIMIEGLALGSFGTLRTMADEPMLHDMLRYVITDEARHVHYGVLAIREFFLQEISDRERKDREDWAFELVLLLRNRFLAHEIHAEFYGHAMSRTEWNRHMRSSGLMALFRRTMFKRIVPNLKRIGLLSARVRPRYEALGLLQYENEKSAPDLQPEDLLRDADAEREQQTARKKKDRPRRTRI